MPRTRIARAAAVASLVFAAALAAPAVTSAHGTDAESSTVLAGDAGWQVTPVDTGRQAAAADAGWQ
ncbi:MULTISPECIES: hypothetical protein [Streptomyces]|uniref:Uncharacterized protein n=1 Tax=Streptomyces canarius TaxID=285453 RepID=A0ABQ3CW71_9ACTN|nr:hypothetical protein [Streptomyces canarius]GHA46945.1 hypothetical protein GCM10010345_59300 [Streptomyces canarius]